MTAADKDTIYIDIDDEITGIIDKFNASDGKIVALVLPKRAAVLQSIVNMKLLKRAADQSKKNLVLVTTEASLMPLAGAVGVNVAKTLTSKPEVPSAPVTDDREETVDEAEEDGETPDFSKSAAAATSVGALSGMPPKPPVTDDVETLELDDDDVEDEDAAKAAAGAGAIATAAKVKKDKKLHVPDFDRFKWMLLLAVVLVPLLGYGLFYALAVAPKAVINISTDAVNVNANFGLTVSTTAKTVDTQQNTVPGKLQTMSKTYTSQGSSTGQKNQGDKASGQVTVTNCSGDAIQISAGTGLSSGGLTFIAQTTVVVPDSNYKSPLQGGACKNDGTASVTVKAQAGGASYNLSSGAKFTVSGESSSTVTGVGGAMTGGTDNIIKVVSQTDIDNAKAKISTQDATVKQTLTTQLQQAGYFAIKSAYSASDPTITPTVQVGDQAESFTVNETITYNMFGAKKADLAKLVDNAISSQIDTTKQTILTEGLDTASFNVTNMDDKGATITLQTVATAGPGLDVNTIKQQAAGQKAGGIKGSLESQPGVTSVEVKLSPFWVSSVPKKTSKITVNISKPTSPAKNGN
ncbi:MAG: hypothetical protein JWO41_408 [Candidatus Saccharibacteria bacterium]|nr:hypothetical protein [Candidatus Saccharibacteria bacterium]